MKTDGPITCSTKTPPRQLEQYGFNTTCSIVKGSQVAAVELTAKRQVDMVPMNRLHALVQKMATRF